jgi:hypothetical protein
MNKPYERTQELHFEDKPLHSINDSERNTKTLQPCKTNYCKCKLAADKLNQRRREIQLELEVGDL